MKIEISRRKRWQLFSLRDLQELNHYRDLLLTLVMRDVNVLYKQTVLGFAWAIIKPAFQMVVFTVVFGHLAGMQKDIGGMPYAIWSFAALVPWTYFATAMTASTGSLVSNTQFLTKVYFPRVIIPLVPIISKLVDFCIAFLVLIPMMIYYHVMPNANLVFLPLLILQMMVIAFGIGLWLSAMAIQYRDVQQLMQFLVQILMYAAPIIWPISYLNNHQTIRTIIAFYPMTGVVEGFRACLLGGPMPWDLIGCGAITGLVILVGGLAYFRNKEDVFADVA